MKTVMLILIYSTISLQVYTQSIERQLLSNAGDQNFVDGCTISWTLGEPFIDSYYSKGYLLTLTEGFQQGQRLIKIENTPVKEISTLTTINIYPNPTRNTLIIELGSPPTQDIRLIITDEKGQKIRSVNIADSITKLDLGELENAVYFIALTDGKCLIKTVEVAKF